MEIITMSLGSMGVNTYLIIDEDTKETAVVDPGAGADLIEKELNKRNCNLKYILLTHAHADHIGAVSYLKEKYPEADIAVHEADVDILKTPHKNYSNAILNRAVSIDADLILKADSKILIGKNEFTIISTPGHTPGSICYYIPNVLISGDTLFKGSVGRWDLFGGDLSSLRESVKKLLRLPEDTKVLPGHGPASTIAFEKQNNMFSEI
ncbi:MAG: MBL fold metallo-hydrolase [Tissierellia bacterium]|nr:MBL fold metallo-hydrolase [Tissierellia bacterium]